MKYIVQKNLDHNLKSFKPGDEIWLEGKETLSLERAGAIKRSEETTVEQPFFSPKSILNLVDSSVDTVDKVAGASGPEMTGDTPLDPDLVGVPSRECPSCGGISRPSKLTKIAKNGNREFTFTCTACLKSSRFWIKQGDKIE